MALVITVNGGQHTVRASPDTPLLYVLRNELHLQEVTFDRSNVTSTAWRTYPILTFVDAPVVETILIDRPELPATGVGEPACNPVPAAVANAVFDAIGVRIRQLPLRPDRVKAALQAVHARA